MMVWFWVLFVSTAVALVAAAWSGRTGRRKLHFALVAIAMALLTATILRTESLTRQLDLPKRELGIHLWFAKSATAIVLATLVTGVVYAARSGSRCRRVHRIAVVAMFTAIAVATGTGIWVVSLAR